MDFWSEASAWGTHSKDLIAIVAGVGGGAFALWRHRGDESWKRRQFAFDYADAVFADPACQLAMNMIDWYGAEGVAPESLTGVKGKPIRWSAGDVARALRINAYGFTPDEYIIRSAFDALLNRLERLSEFVRRGTLPANDFPSSLKYYLARARQRSDGLGEAFYIYLAHYQFGCTAWLAARIVEKQPVDTESADSEKRVETAISPPA